MTQLFKKMILPSSNRIRFLSQCYSLMALLLLASSSPAQLEGHEDCLLVTTRRQR